MQSGRGPGRCGNRASCLSLTFNPALGRGGRTLLPVFPLPLVWDRHSQGTHLGSQLCRDRAIAAPGDSFPKEEQGTLCSCVPCGPQLRLQQLLLRSWGKERGSRPPPARAGLLSCSSPSVAPDSSRFTVCHLSLVQQTLPFLRSKGFKTCFLELPFSVAHTIKKAARRLGCQPCPAPCPGCGGPLLVPAPLPALRRGWVTARPLPAPHPPSGRWGRPLPWVRRSLRRRVGLGGAGPTESLSKVAFSGEYITRGAASFPLLSAPAASGAVGVRQGRASEGRTFPGVQEPCYRGMFRGGGGTPQLAFLDKPVPSAPVPLCPPSLPACSRFAAACRALSLLRCSSPPISRGISCAVIKNIPSLGLGSPPVPLLQHITGCFRALPPGQAAGQRGWQRAAALTFLPGQHLHVSCRPACSCGAGMQYYTAAEPAPAGRPSGKRAAFCRSV